MTKQESGYLKESFAKSSIRQPAGELALEASASAQVQHFALKPPGK